MPDYLLEVRVANSERSTSIFRGVTTFEELLKNQHKESHQIDVSDPTGSEAYHLFVIKSAEDVDYATRTIVSIVEAK